MDIEETQFLSLARPRNSRDECWNQVVVVDGDVGDGRIRYSGEWIGILRATRQEMEIPRVLSRVNWINRIERLRERLVIGEDAEVGEMEEPEKTTIRFCQRLGVFCPNPEIRKLMTPESPVFGGWRKQKLPGSRSRTWRSGRTGISVSGGGMMRLSRDHSHQKQTPTALPPCFSIQLAQSPTKMSHIELKPGCPGTRRESVFLVRTPVLGNSE
jgi:hypothetical protein